MAQPVGEKISAYDPFNVDRTEVALRAAASIDDIGLEKIESLSDPHFNELIQKIRAATDPKLIIALKAQLYAALDARGSIVRKGDE